MLEQVVTGLPAGFYASLAAAGLTKCGTITGPNGQRSGWLLNAQQQILSVVSLRNRNLRGEPMRLVLELVAG